MRDKNTPMCLLFWTTDASRLDVRGLIADLLPDWLSTIFSTGVAARWTKFFLCVQVIVISVLGLRVENKRWIGPLTGGDCGLCL